MDYDQAYGIFNSSSSDDETETAVEDRRHQFRQRVNFNIENMSEIAFKERFRVHHETFDFLLEHIGPFLQKKTNSHRALSPQQQLLVTLHWLGNGAQFHVTADCHGVSKATVHNCVHKVCGTITEKLFPEFVRWPPDQNDRVQIARKFAQESGMPEVIAGVVDGTLIPVDAPHQNEEQYVDRHLQHSINGMFVCGPHLEFFYASMRWPGSVHDSRVLRNSSLAMEWDGGFRPFPGAVIIGDSAYGLKEWLISPNIPNIIPYTPAVQRYLASFKSTRRLVECAFGVIKERFPTLNYLRLQPEAVASVVYACVSLHNIEIMLNREDYSFEWENLANINENNNEIDNNAINDEFGNANENAINNLQQIINHFNI